MVPSFQDLSAALADRYRIERELGAGGMATVYLAEDLKHDRKVAIKVLKPELAAVLGAERFVQEIKTTAALSHPHILPLFDSGEAGGFLYYVMPFIEGETIREKLNRETQFGIDEAVRITTEVADALDYAHRHGVIHRDIKPENILLHDGRAMVMDFGIALAVSAAAGGRMTETGLSLGTPHYMSPEQATADKQITARSDVYSLASVLYEMLTGEPPHTGSSVQAIIMKIIAEPVKPATDLRKSVPPHVGAALARALEKLPADRFDGARAFAEALGDRGFRLADGDPTAVGAGDGAGRGSTGWRASAAVPLAVLSTVLAAALAFVWFRPPSSDGLDRPTFASLDVSGMGVLGFGSDMFAVAPDGRSVVFVVEDGLAIRSLDSTGVVPLARTSNATFPFWSPDGRAIGFFARDSLRVIELASGAVRALCAVPGGSGGGTWSPNGTILFSSGDSLATADARGGRCTGERGAAPDPANYNSLRPYFLSDGRHYVASGDMKIWLGALGSDSLVLLQEGFRHEAVAAAPDYLLWNGNDRLVAQRIDIAQGRLVGEPVPVLPRMPTPGGHTAVSASANGVLVGFRNPRLNADSGARNLMLADRGTGQLRGMRGSKETWRAIRWSHDGRRVAMGGWQVKAMDAATGRWVRVGGSSEGPEAIASDPLWAPRDSALLFEFGAFSDAGGTPGLYSASVANGINRRIVAWPPPPLAGCCAGRLDDLSPDGRRVVFSFGAAQFLLNQAWEYDLQADSARRLFDAEGRIDDLRYDPSGGWIAYQVTTGARTDVFVRPYPGPGTPVRVTNGDGRVPRWRADGSELFYVDAAGNIVSVAVRAGSTLSIGPPQVVLSAEALPGRRLEEFDVSPDGRRLALLARPYVDSFLLVFDWHGLLEAGNK